MIYSNGLNVIEAEAHSLYFNFFASVFLQPKQYQEARSYQWRSQKYKGLLELSRQSLLSFDRKLFVEKSHNSDCSSRDTRLQNRHPLTKTTVQLRRKELRNHKCTQKKCVTFPGKLQRRESSLHISSKQPPPPFPLPPNTTTTMTLGKNFSRFCFAAFSLTGSFSLPLLPQPLLQLRWACWGNTERADVDVPQRKLCPHPLRVEPCVAYSRLFRLTVKQQATKYGSSTERFTFSITGAQRREQDRLT